MQAPLQIIAVPAFKDNYIWLIHNGTQAVAVDPGDAEPVLNALNLLGLNLHSILITHHHHDHIDGVNTLLGAYPKVNIYAPKHEQYDFKHTSVCEPDIVRLSDLNIDFNVIDLPGHTLGHIAYFSAKPRFATANPRQKLLFCGDTLFGAGCGRLFEGTAEQMFASLQKLAALPAETLVYCTHEYTLHNIEFALTLEPSNQALLQRQQDTIKLRAQHQPSLPSNIALELATNPFLRCNSHEIKSSTHLKNASALQVFSAIREIRNHY